MANFDYLKSIPQFNYFADAAIDAEKLFRTSPTISTLQCRKALDLAVKWFYQIEKLKPPYEPTLGPRVYDDGFIAAVGNQEVWKLLPPIVKFGNIATHQNTTIKDDQAMSCLQGLFFFIKWLDYLYDQPNYEDRKFSVKAIPMALVAIDKAEVERQRAALSKMEEENEALKQQLAELAEQLEAEKAKSKPSVEKPFTPADLSEFETRKVYIDFDLCDAGWVLEGPNADVWQEYEVEDMENHIGQKGYVDYVLMGKDGKPLAVVEAKRTSKDPNVGQQQAKLYADCLERRFGRRPMMFTSNGFETWFWDDKSSPIRRVSSFFSKDDLQRLMNRRTDKQDLSSIRINDKITDRYYQKEAITAVCDNIIRGRRKNLLVMATGTGKTRTASSLVDVLSRAGYVTNVLFLADRTALVKQAKDDFKNYLPDMSLCNLLDNKEDRTSRIVFSTYPTMMNMIDDARTEDDHRFFTPAHFDLIIIDEAHRSIFKKYKAIFEYFDAILVGLTATPKKDVDRNTYEFFDLEDEIPTYAYDYKTAVEQDHVLVPYYNIEVSTMFMSYGITYDDLSPEDQERYENDFIEDGERLPTFVPSAEMNKYVFNQNTVDNVLQDLMTKGIKVAGGDRLAKSIIFAQNKQHAEYILQRFNTLYPEYNGTFARRVICDDAYAQSLIDDFKQPAPPVPYNYEDEKDPVIVVSVDMMDTGIDVPHVANLVFFKQVRSKTKFWQMIGRGTRLCKGMECFDSIDGEYTDKRRFFIFDYCGNFEFFREHKEGFEGTDGVTLSESIFSRRIRLIAGMQSVDYLADGFQSFRTELIDTCHQQIVNLKDQLIEVQLEREFVNRYRNKDAFQALTELDVDDLIKHIAPIVKMDDDDVQAKRFDNFMYDMMLSLMNGTRRFDSLKRQLENIAEALLNRATIPQIQKKVEVLKSLQEDAFWAAADILMLENIRKELRDLIQFMDQKKKTIVYTNLEDQIVSTEEGKMVEEAYDFEGYRKRVGRYVEEHRDSVAIHKLTHNIVLNEMDYQELERVLTEELGSKEEYESTYGDTPFGLMIRQIAHLDHQAAMDAFSSFISDQSLRQDQIVFVHKIINHIERNGYMEDIGELLKPPFDKPRGFGNVFSMEQQKKIINIIQSVKDNAVNVVA